MKAPSFAYARPSSLDEVLKLLAEHGVDAKLLAGGQSLLPALNMRLASPRLLIDLGALTSLAAIEQRDGRIRIGALVTHRTIERSAEIAEHLPLLTQAAPHIAHVAIRNVGTFAGSLATGDPAAEWPACCVALGAELVLASRDGERRVPAVDFFQGMYATALEAHEVITGVEIPVPPRGHRAAFLELARRHGDYATAGVAAIGVPRDGVLRNVRMAVFGISTVPVLARSAMAALEGSAADPAAITKAQDALESDVEPMADLYTSGAAKLHLARVLLGRAVAELA